MFYADDIIGERAFVRGETADHLHRVLRVTRGTTFEISDNERLRLGEVTTVTKDFVEFALGAEVQARQLGAQIMLCASLVKFDRLEWVIEKATELGVEIFIPLVASRCDAGLEKAALKRLTRWKRIIDESGQQCRRVKRMAIQPPLSVRQALAVPATTRMLLDEEGGTPVLRCAVLSDGPIALYVGPEGGWDASERKLALASGCISVSLGEQVLRAETAAIGAVACLQAGHWAKHSI